MLKTYKNILAWAHAVHESHNLIDKDLFSAVQEQVEIFELEKNNIITMTAELQNISCAYVRSAVQHKSIGSVGPISKKLFLLKTALLNYCCAFYEMTMFIQHISHRYSYLKNDRLRKEFTDSENSDIHEQTHALEKLVDVLAKLNNCIGSERVLSDDEIVMARCAAKEASYLENKLNKLVNNILATHASTPHEICSILREISFCAEQIDACNSMIDDFVRRMTGNFPDWQES